MNLVDTSGWIEYFFGGPNAAFFAAPIEDVAELVVPVICLYEVFKKVNIVADEARGLQAVAQMKQGRIVDVLGIGMFALPTGIRGAGFIEAIQKSKQPREQCPHRGKDLP